jgi:hypothetical protein
LDFDVKQHEKNKNRFLKAMYELLKEEKDANPTMDESFWFGGVNNTARHAGLSMQELHGITTDLEEGMLIEPVEWCSEGDQGQEYKFTTYGLQSARQLLYDESPLAKQRKFFDAVKEKLAAVAMSILKEAWKWLGGIVIGAVGASYRPAITKWIKELLGIK